jgi:hypothetical protein
MDGGPRVNALCRDGARVGRAASRGASPESRAWCDSLERHQREQARKPLTSPQGNFWINTSLGDGLTITKQVCSTRGGMHRHRAMRLITLARTCQGDERQANGAGDPRLSPSVALLCPERGAGRWGRLAVAIQGQRPPPRGLAVGAGTSGLMERSWPHEQCSWRADPRLTVGFCRPGPHRS